MVYSLVMFVRLVLYDIMKVTNTILVLSLFMNPVTLLVQPVVTCRQSNIRAVLGHPLTDCLRAAVAAHLRHPDEPPSLQRGFYHLLR